MAVDLLQRKDPMRNRTAFLITISFCFSTFALCQTKSKIILDEFFNAVYYRDLRLSPDGNAVVFTTERADWDKERFRDDLWLYRVSNGTLLPLTQSGHDNNPQFSPDGQWIAFLSDRANEAGSAKDSDDDKDKSKETPHVYVISASGGEAFAVTRGEEEVHAYAWAPDSKSIYFATRTPWSKEKKDAYKKEWKDTLEYRNSERGDVIARIALADVLSRHLTLKADEEKDSGEKAKEKEKHEETAETPGSVVVTSTPVRVRQLAVSSDNAKLAFLTSSISEREESAAEYEIFVAELATLPSTAKRLTNNSAIEFDIRWSADNRHIFFQNSEGSVEGPKYADTQNHVYWIDANTGEIEQWAKPFSGALNEYAPLKGDSLLSAGMLGTQVQIYSLANAGADAKKISSWPGGYANIAASPTSPRIAFAYSRVNQPTELFLAESLDQLSSAKPITTFNHLFTERALPDAKPFQWKADDGVTVEGLLIYPPGKFEAKNLRMLTLIHGGPIDADGDRFGADWYDWAILAASEGWLVFRPNYRGSTGYGDVFEQAIVPHLVSKPGRDILEGVDALVKAGIADPNQLAVGGYSYGGYMTNWLITQTDRFKAAVTGAGAVEHAANWGNDDTTLDDAWYLGGPPWAAQKMYTDEAALFQMNKVKTPTHMVAGSDDIRVAVLEDYLLEHALKTLNIPSALLVFPGEGHGLGKNPWHGKIKVREELKWLEKYLPAKTQQ
jgi:dipeptidyl aminopeptidase/acylaminoacyl peptidase